MNYKSTSADNPTLIILAIDRDKSLAKTFKTVEDKSLSYAEIETQLRNRIIYSIIRNSMRQGRIYNRYICSIIEYTIEKENLQIKTLVSPSFSTDLAKTDFQNIETSSTVTPLSSILSFAENWARQNTNSLPPIIINLTESLSNLSTSIFKQFQNITVNGGASLIFNCFIDKLPASVILSGRLQDILEESILLPRKMPSLDVSTERARIHLLKAGTQIGNYIIAEKIGEGGVGAIYKARHKILNQTVAIKVLDSFPNDTVISTTFLQAANYLSQLNNPNIVGLYDYGLMQDKAYMAMEFVEGITLDKLIPKTPSEAWTKRAIFMFVQLISAVRYAHSCLYQNLSGYKVQGIIHGDIKPGNVLVTLGSDTIKLTDFMIPDVQQYLTHDNLELKKLLAPFGTPFTNEEKQVILNRIMPAITAAFGTPKYMPPEQWDGKVSIQTDIFSLGATLYELLTGLPPVSLFKGIRPRQVNPFISEWVEELIIKSMKIEPSERFNSVAEIEALFRDNLTERIEVKELVMGNKIEFNNTGTVNNNGQLFIGKFNDVYTNLNTSGNIELAEALKTLKEAIMASKEMSEIQKQENIEVVNKIGDEALKNKPNKTLIKSLGEGLLSTLKTIPDIVEAVAAIAPFITGLK